MGINPNIFIKKENNVNWKNSPWPPHAPHIAPSLPHLTFIKEKNLQISTGRLLQSSIWAQIQSTEYLVLSFMSRKWQTAKQVNSHTQSAVEPSATLRNFQSVHFSFSMYKINISADQSTEKLRVGALDWRLRASVQSFCYTYHSKILCNAKPRFTLNQGTFSFKRKNIFFDNLGLIVLSLADVAIG